MVTEGSVMAVIRASRPSFRNPSDAVAFAVHSSFLAAGYSLIATGRVVFSDNPPLDGEEEVGIEGWNELEDSYGFLYLKSDKGLKKRILVKCLAIGDAFVVDAVDVKEKHKEPFHIQINVKEFVLDDVDKKSNYGEMYKNLHGLIESLNASIFNKLERMEVGSSSSASGAERYKDRTDEPTYRGPCELQPLPQGLVYPPVPPHGSSDLFPGPGAGVYPPRVPGIGGGMLIGPNDPRWFGIGEHPGQFPGGVPGVPPGARFDPYGPPDVPGFEPGRFIRQPPRRPGGGTHPDLEHFQGPDYI